MISKLVAYAQLDREYVALSFMMGATVCSPAEALVVLGHGKTHLLLHVHTILAGTSLNEGPIKEVTIIGDIHTWLHLQQVDGDCMCLIICLSITWAQSVP